MKIKFIALITALIALSACSASSSTAKKEKTAADFEQIASLIDSGSYQFTVRSATPSGGRTIQITTLYSLKARDGQYEAYLPYFGRAYSGGYGDSGGVEFKGSPEKLEITRKDNKNLISVKFTIKSEREQYTVNLEVGASGYGSLVISSQNRRTISYSGLAAELVD